MTSGQYLAFMFSWLIIVLLALYSIAKFIDMWYEKKDKEKKTDIVCPRSGLPLNTTELFNGRCFKCPNAGSLPLLNSIFEAKVNCSVHIKKQCSVKS